LVKGSDGVLYGTTSQGGGSNTEKFSRNPMPLQRLAKALCPSIPVERFRLHLLSFDPLFFG
jgi:hypothetical protein